MIITKIVIIVFYTKSFYFFVLLQEENAYDLFIRLFPQQDTQAPRSISTLN